MNLSATKFLLLASATMSLSAAFASSASAAIIISEVDAAGSASSSGYNADWFELTNTGSSAVSIAGWKMDDNHASYSAADSLTGVTTLAAGQSVVFLESTGSTPATVDANFESVWFGSSVPASFTVGNYSGGNVGLSQTTDAVNIYDSTGTVVASVNFNASSPSTGTFDNTAGLNNTTLTTFSALGVNGAFKSANGEIGSPGIDSAISPTPLPPTFWLFASGLLGLAWFAGRRQTR